MPETPEEHDQDPDTDGTAPGAPGAASGAANGAANGSGNRSGDAEADDLKARMRAALERKQHNDRGVTSGGHKRGKAPDTHGPLGGVHMHRRKAGGGGS